MKLTQKQLKHLQFMSSHQGECPDVGAGCHDCIFKACYRDTDFYCCFIAIKHAEDSVLNVDNYLNDIALQYINQFKLEMLLEMSQQ